MTEAEKRVAEDTQLFDEFLHVTNESAFEAMKMAENEINRHIEKINQIKSINAQICEVRSDICRLEDIFAFKEDSLVISHLLELRGGKEDGLWNEIEKRRRILDYMSKEKILEFKDVTEMIRSYYKDPSSVLDKVGSLKKKSNLKSGEKK